MEDPDRQAVTEPAGSIQNEDAEIDRLWRLAGLPFTLQPPITLTGPPQWLPSVFPVTTLAATAIAASSAAAAALWQLRNGEPKPRAITLDRAHAAAAFRGERYLRIDDAPAAGLWEPLSGYYPTSDGRRLLLHANLPPHVKAALNVLEVGPDKDAVTSAIATWDAFSLEEAIHAAGGCCAAMRTQAEWRAHPQAVALSGLPTIEVQPVGSDAGTPVPPGRRPLDGIRVLDLTRVIAGPVATRTLAAHGADVLRIGAAHLSDNPTLIIETGFGKRSAGVDLRDDRGVDLVRQLASQADVVIQSYRPTSLAARGLGADDIFALNPAAVYVTLSAYGRVGPWSNRRGFDSLVQMASGIVAAGSSTSSGAEPVPLPAQALDHASGYLAAFGTIAALIRRQLSGGSWLVQLSLAQTGEWLTSLGTIDGLHVHDPTMDDALPFTERTPSSFGELTHIRPAGDISGVRPHWDLPPVPLGTDEPAWVA
jgi:crotonobetainyl-CoA:carnitine CoA-transferase CaiB-like acyl-CoA transferase